MHAELHRFNFRHNPWRPQGQYYNLEYYDLEGSECLKPFVLHSESLLNEIFNDDEYLEYDGKDQVSLYELATAFGWRKGCEMLYARKIPIGTNVFGVSLLYRAISQGAIDVFEFWLDLRSTIYDAASLERIGDLVESLGCANQWAVIRIDPIITTLVEQRTALRLLASSRLLSEQWEFYSGRSAGLLDSQAHEVYETLINNGVDVSPHLKPSKLSVYTLVNPSVDTLEKLYAAGFHAPTGPISADIPMSPLMFYLTHFLKPPTADVVQWFLAKGA
jgi:hypothetical protein